MKFPVEPQPSNPPDRPEQPPPSNITSFQRNEGPPKVTPPLEFQQRKKIQQQRLAANHPQGMFSICFQIWNRIKQFLYLTP